MEARFGFNERIDLPNPDNDHKYNFEIARSIEWVPRVGEEVRLPEVNKWCESWHKRLKDTGDIYEDDETAFFLCFDTEMNGRAFRVFDISHNYNRNWVWIGITLYDPNGNLMTEKYANDYI